MTERSERGFSMEYLNECFSIENSVLVWEDRSLFDRWVLTHPDNLDLTKYEENIMFDAWQASANQQGYKLVRGF